MISEVSKITGVPESIILGRKSTQLYNCVRQLYWKLLREKKRFAFRHIAELCDTKTETVQYGVKRVNGLLESNDEMAVKMWNKIKDIK